MPYNNYLNYPYPNLTYSTSQPLIQNQIQNPMPSQMKPMIPGKVITDQTNIMPQDVPMDGSVGLFPTQDMGCIYAKAWNSNGTITTIKYVPEKESDQEPKVNLETVSNKLDKIEAMLKQRVTHSSKRKENANVESATNISE